MKLFAATSILLLSIATAVSSFADTEKSAEDFFPLVKSQHEKIWNYSPQQIAFCLKNRHLFSWTSRQRNALRYALKNRRGILYWHDLPVCEAVLNFKRQKLNNIVLSLYNKADYPKCGKSEYTIILEKSASSLDAIYGVQNSKRQAQNIGGIRIYSRTWTDKNNEAVLDWSYSGTSRSSFKPEFINITIRSKISNAATESDNRRIGSTVKAALAKRVTRDDNGDIYISLPMVNQGQRGYCVAASIARILKYYGSTAGQHLLAALVNTDPEKGTSLESVERAIQKVGLKFRFYTREICDRKLFREPKNLLTIIPKYNKIAKRNGKPELNAKDYVQKRRRFTFLSRQKLLRDFDEESFIAVCMKEENAFRSFKRKITAAINAGTPVLWAVQLGVIKEGKKRQFGWHMRIVNGYNSRNDELIYSDSWGKGHEEKKLTWAQAWSMSIAAYMITPRNN
ncbi:cysteine peptidase family C39 domain-containing protein [Lentisphaerota bacterium ZTH]|nr:hypothetical protein JYG24_09610 [Lentisphaerota bacterium]WET06251.1 cysteine peptidase family C39 domain-containing protein [Lentisphaerota bacterium ZTH]